MGQPTLLGHEPRVLPRTAILRGLDSTTKWARLQPSRFRSARAMPRCLSPHQQTRPQKPPGVDALTRQSMRAVRAAKVMPRKRRQALACMKPMRVSSSNQTKQQTSCPPHCSVSSPWASQSVSKRF